MHVDIALVIPQLDKMSVYAGHFQEIYISNILRPDANACKHAPDEIFAMKNCRAMIEHARVLSPRARAAARVRAA